MNNYLESQVDKLIDFIIKSEIGFGWKNHPNRLFNGSFVQGEPFDYCILTKFKHVCFDAKETEKTVWNIAKKDIIQAKNLLAASKSGIECFFLIYFITSKQLVKINIADFLEILLGENRKHIKPTDCIPFDFKELIEEKPKTRKEAKKNVNIEG